MMEGWNYTFALLVLCVTSWMPTQVTQAQTYTLNEVNRQKHSREDTAWHTVQEAKSYFTGYTVFRANSTGKIRIDNITISTGSCDNIDNEPVTCDFSTGFCDFRNDHCSDEADFTISGGMLEADGTGEALLVFPGNTSPGNRCVKFSYQFESGTVGDYIHVDAFFPKTGVSDLKSSSSFASATDYFCNFDGDNKLCYWDIREPHENFYVECMTGGSGGLAVDQSYGKSNKGKYLHFGEFTGASDTDVIELVGPAVPGDPQEYGICFSMFFYISVTAPDSIIVGYEPTAGDPSFTQLSSLTDQGTDWQHFLFNVASKEDFRVVIRVKHKTGRFIGIDNLRLYAKTDPPPDVQCESRVEKVNLTIGGLDCSFSSDARSPNPGAEVVPTGDMCLWSNVLGADANWKVTTAGHLESVGSASLTSPTFEVIAITDTDDKRLRCFSMSYLNMGTMKVTESGLDVWTDMTAMASDDPLKKLELGLVLQNLNAVMGVITDTAGSRVDNLKVAPGPCGCRLNEDKGGASEELFCDWEFATNFWFSRAAGFGADDAHSCVNELGVETSNLDKIPTTKSFGPTNSRCIRISYYKPSGTTVTFGLQSNVGGVKKQLWNTTEAPGADVWNTYLISYSETMNHELQFFYEKSDSFEQICLNNLVFADAACSIVGCNAGEFEGPTVSHEHSEVSQCEKCDYGTYGTEPGLDNCTDCTDKDSNSTASKGSTSPTQCTPDLCGVGYFEQSGCTRCAQDKYKDVSGPGPCDDCPNGKMTLDLASNSIDDCLCQIGTELNAADGSCQDCEVGYYGNVVGQACQPCPEMRTTENPGADNQVLCKCGPGQKYTGSQCEACEVGTFQNKYHNNLPNCGDCPMDTTTVNNGSTFSDCVCVQGMFKNAAMSCQDCTLGTFKAMVGDETCDFCNSTRMFTTTVETGAVNSSFCECDKGYGFDNGNCTLCPIGSYKDNIGDTNCTLCVTGRTTRTEGATMDSECECIEGYYPNPPAPTSSDPCIPCVEGYFKGDIGNDNCKKCGTDTSMPVELTTFMPGSLSNMDCVCIEGYITNGTESCEACQEGFYADMKNSSECTPCPAFSTSEDTKSKNVTDCECQPGYYMNGVVCEPCGFNKYKTELGNSEISCLYCTDTITGPTITLADNSTELNQCVCDVGTYDSGGNLCYQCAQHLFQNEPGNSPRCKKCGDAEGRNFTASEASTDQANCTCNKGEYFNGICLPCPESQFQDKYPMLDESCQMCSDNKSNSGHNTTGQTDLSDCLCVPGFFQDADGNCTECDIGSYQDQFMDTNTCSPCGENRTTLVPGASSEAQCICDKGYQLNEMQCVPCPIGEYNDVANGTCVPCAPGELTLDVGSDAPAKCLCGPGLFRQNDPSPCKPCGFGKYKDDTGNNETQCVDCAGGVVPTEVTTMVDNATAADMCFCNIGYSRAADGDVTSMCTACINGTWSGNLTNSDSCTTCRSNSTTNDTARTMASDCGCNPGFYDNGMDCEPCDKGFYNDLWNQNTCKPCPNGQDTSTTGSDDISSCICPAGYTRNGSDTGPCMECGFGKYKGDAGNAACDTCPDLLHTTLTNTSSNDTQCLCDSGSSGDSSTCTECPMGTFSEVPTTSNCSFCPADRNTTGPGASECYCLSGLEDDGSGNCVECPVGTYKDDLLGNCTDCVDNDTLTTNGTGADDFSLCICNKGYTGSEPYCIACQKGEYKDVKGQSSCKTCDTGSTTNDTAADNASLCLCDIGFEGNGSACVECLAGTFKDFIGGMAIDDTSSRCQSCMQLLGAEYTSVGTGLTHRDNCTCISGYEKNAMNECANCSIGSYKSTAGDEPCTNCTDPITETTLREGADNVAECVCKSGHELVSGSCTKCQAGYFKEMPGNHNCSKCSDPIAVTAADGATSETLCVCPPGYTSINGAQCSACGIRKYKNTTSNSECDDCGENKSTVNGNSTDIAMCLCIPGTYLNGGACDPCPKGRYTDALNSKTLCDNCVGGRTTLQTKADDVDLCVCVPGSYENAAGTCETCDPGTYKEVASNDKADCLSCPGFSTTLSPGRIFVYECVCVAGHEGLPCAPCANGTYKTIASNNSCLQCDSGQTTVSTGSTMATDCLCKMGKESVGGSCVACRNGYYKDKVSDASCTACPGTNIQTSPSQGATSPDNCGCDPGLYKNNGVCTNCGPDTYKPSIGDDKGLCKDCPAGGTTYGKTGATSSSDCICKPGYKTDLLKICTTCGSTSYSTTNNSATCTACPENQVTGSLTAIAASECKCPAGYVLDTIYGTKKCSPTPPSYVSTASGCSRCPSNLVSAIPLLTNVGGCEQPAVVKRATRVLLVKIRLPSLTFTPGMGTTRHGCTMFAILYPILVQLYESLRGFRAIVPENIYAGSVLAHFSVLMTPDSTLTAQEAQDIINNGANNFIIGANNSDFAIDPAGTDILSVIDYPDTDIGEDDTDYKMTAVIVGTVIPGLILLALLIACCCKISKRNRRNDENSEPSVRHSDMGGGQPIYPQVYQTPVPWLTRMARWAPLYNANNTGYGNMQTNGVYMQQGYSTPQAYGKSPAYGYNNMAPAVQSYKGSNWWPWQRGYSG